MHQWVQVELRSWQPTAGHAPPGSPTHLSTIFLSTHSEFLPHLLTPPHHRPVKHLLHLYMNPIHHHHSSIWNGLTIPLFNRSHPPSLLHGGLHLLVSLFLSNSIQTPHLFLCLIFFFFDFRFCCYCGGVNGGVLVDFGGNGAMGVIFFLFSIWILGGWWWVVLFLGGGGGWTK